MKRIDRYELFAEALGVKSFIEDDKVSFVSLCRLVHANPLITTFRVRRDTGMWGGELLSLMRYCREERKRDLSSGLKPRKEA